MKIKDVMQLNNDLTYARNIVTDTEFSDENFRKDLINTLDDAIQFCRYIYMNTDVLGVRND